MATSGPNNAGTGADDATVGTVAWSNTSNITADDISNATASLNASQSHYLKATNFGFSIPAGSIIDGIETRFKRSGGAFITDTDVKIVKGGAISSTDLSAGAAWSVGEEFVTFGGATSKWGETWTATDINDSTFGVVLSATGSALATASVNVVDIKIYYTLGGGGDSHGRLGFFGI